MGADAFGIVTTGLVLGAAYALAALGLSVLYGVLGVVNFAHGEILMLGAFLGAAVFRSFGGDYGLTVVAVFVVGSLFGVLLHYLVFLPLGSRGVVSSIAGTLGLSFFLYHMAVFVSGATNLGQPVLYRTTASAEIRVFGVELPTSVVLFGTRVGSLRLVVGLLAVLLVSGVSAFLGHSQFGRALKAVAWNRDTAALLGISVAAVSLCAVAFTTGITFAAGALSGALLTATPGLGIPFSLKSFVVVICSGFGNVQTTLLVGLLLGLTEAVAVALTGSQSQYLWVFGLVVVLMMVLPTGLRAERSA